jgi:hypothetical protein
MLNKLSSDLNRVQTLPDGTRKLEKPHGDGGKLVIRIANDFEKLAGERDALLLMYDVTSEESFQFIKDYLSIARKVNYKSTFLVGNKSDLIESR